jgi:hypothetical protein
VAQGNVIFTDNIQDISAESLKMFTNALHRIHVLLKKLQVFGIWDTADNFIMDFLGL